MPQSLPVQVEAPFSVDRALVELSGGDSAVLVVRFEPAAEGVFHGVLKVGRAEVRLDGEALAPPSCRPTDDCHDASFDPATGACLQRVVADGTACATDVCLEGGRCISGQCVGAPRSCDDGDACTSDACVPGTGCQHTDASAECPAATDPCHAAACDPRTGCGVVPVADGTPCGEVTCVTADVCMQGRCVQLVPPDGYQCAPATPCQDRGVCQSQQCVQAPQHPLSPLWTWEPVGDDWLVFDGVSDPQGNFWWVECAMGETMSCHAVSVTRDGLLRFTGDAVTGMRSPTVAQLFDEGRFVFVTDSGLVVAVDGATGREQWRAQLPASFVQYGWVAPQPSLTSDGRGHLWLASGEDGRCLVDLPWTAALVQLDAATGALRFETLFPATGAPVADEQGNLFATRQAWPASLASWSPQAALRFEVPADGGVGLVAAGQGRVVMQSNRAFATGNGVELSPWDDDRLIGESALQVGGQTIRLQREPTGPLPPVMPGTNLVLFDAANPAGRTLAHVAGPASEVTAPVLASRDTVLVAGRQTPTTSTLVGVTTAGVTRFACELTEPALGGMFSSLSTRVGFTGDRFAVLSWPQCPTCLRAPSPILSVFSTPGLGVAPAGWVAPRGTPGNAGRPR